MDRGAWRAIVHGDVKSRTRLSNWAWYMRNDTWTSHSSGLILNNNSGLWHWNRLHSRFTVSWTFFVYIAEVLGAPLHACMLNHFSCVRLSATPWTIAPRLFCLWDSPGKNIGVRCHFLLQGSALEHWVNSRAFNIIKWGGKLPVEVIKYLISLIFFFNWEMLSGIDRNFQLSQIFGYLNNQNIPLSSIFRETGIHPSVESTPCTEQRSWVKLLIYLRQVLSPSMMYS